MKTIFPCAAVLLLCLTTIPVAHAGAPLSLYDNFAAKFIDLDKWVGLEWQSAYTMREAVRQIEKNRLHIAIRGYGETSTATWGSSANNRVRFTNWDAVTAIKATIQVVDYELDGSMQADNNTIAARIGGYFFNVSTPTAGSAVDDVWASIRVVRKLSYDDPVDTLRVEAYAFRCTDKDCNVGPYLGKETLGTIKVGQKATVRLEWDKTNHRFLGQLNNKRQVVMPYTVSDTSKPAMTNNKRLDVQYAIYNSEAAPRSVAFMSAYFTNVYVNKSAISAKMSAVEDDAALLEDDVDDGAGGS